MTQLTPPLSRLAFGVTGPHATPLISAKRTEALIQDAAAQGVTVFDTAPFAAEGERRLGAALAGLERARMCVCVKVGSGERRGGRRVKDFTPDGVAASLEASLERLGCGYGDIVFLHAPPLEAFTDPLLHRLANLKAAGVVRKIGVCGRGVELDRGLETEAFDAVMAPAFLGQPEDAAARWRRWRAAGGTVFGVETFLPARRIIRAPRGPADLWAAARAAHYRRQGGPAPAPADVTACLDWALSAQGPDVVCLLTTKRRHLRANIARAEGICA